MSARGWRPAAGVLVISVAPLLGQGEQPAPVFRADASAVAVNVSVKKGNTPVQGLSAGDFRLYDNDVLQEVTAISVDAVPLDVSIVVDTSGSAFPDVSSVRQSVQRMMAFLRPADRARVLTMGNAVVTAIPWRHGNASDMSDESAIELADGQISLVADSVLMALFHRTPADRRHVVVALTDGVDWCSLVSDESLRRGAERSGAVLHWIRVQFPRGRLTIQDIEQLGLPVAASGGVHSYCRWSGNRSVDMSSPLADAVRLTGGSQHVTSYGEAVVAVEAFNRILDDFRRSYVLHYVPRGVERTGWHRLRVEMTTSGYTVREARATGAPHQRRPGDRPSFDNGRLRVP